MSEEQERWLPVVGAEGEYEVSDLGRVRSLDRVVADHSMARSRRFRGRILNLVQGDGNGHLAVGVGRLGRRYVHSLVLEAFVRSAFTGEECRHLDGDPTNNALYNLAWGSRGENGRDKKHHRTSRHATGKLSAREVKEVLKLLRDGERQVVIAGMYGVHQSTVSLIKCRCIHTDVS